MLLAEHGHPAAARLVGSAPGELGYIKSILTNYMFCTGAFLNKADLRGALLENARISRAGLHLAKIDAAQLKEAILE